MDFNDWIAENNEKYGLTDDDWNNVRKNAILSFTEEKDGRAVSRHNGIPVFRHKDFESIILPGQTWICSLDTSHMTYYFAKGIQRIDSAFMFELKRDQLDEIATAIWDSQRHVVEPLLDEKYKDAVEERIRKEVDAAESAYRDRIAELERTVIDLEHRDSENKHIITSLQEKLDAKAPVQDAVRIHPFQEYVPNNIVVRRLGPDVISSDYFTRPRYFVHMSADHRSILVRPHDDGTVICINNIIPLEGLSQVSHFREPGDMVSEYSAQYGGVQIYL